VKIAIQRNSILLENRTQNETSTIINYAFSYTMGMTPLCDCNRRRC